MAKRSKKKKAIRGNDSLAAPGPKEPHSQSIFRTALSGAWVPLLLAAATFLIYWPSLKSDFVYDGYIEIIQEGFITSLSNLPDVFSLKVLGMNYQLGDRPGQLLYLMFIAAMSGKAPFGYHLGSNLLHAANVALLFVLLLRLAKTEMPGLAGRAVLKVQLAVAVVTLIFALHPLAVEPVANVSYSSDLLMTFFTLLALLAATAFNPENFRLAVTTGCAGTLCAFAAVSSKESGLAAALLLVVYWFLFRRREAKGPWLWFLGAAMAVTSAFLAARFLLAPPAPVPNTLTYLGGSFSQVLLIQPRLWVFMMGKLFWPVQLSADYAMADLSGLSTSLALAILVIVILLQVWLAFRSRLGGLGVTVYWLGLVTVSNFIPLYRILGDRFYYLPLAGVAMQLLALLLMTLRSRDGFWAAVAPCLVALLPLTLLTVTREDVFASDFTLWSDTVQASPFSQLAHANLGFALGQRGQVDEAITQLQEAVEISPDYPVARYNLGVLLAQTGRVDEAIVQFKEALRLKPDLSEAQNSLAAAMARQRADRK